jgi:hypothetical protein
MTSFDIYEDYISTVDADGVEIKRIVIPKVLDNYRTYNMINYIAVTMGSKLEIYDLNLNKIYFIYTRGSRVQTIHEKVLNDHSKVGWEHYTFNSLKLPLVIVWENINNWLVEDLYDGTYLILQDENCYTDHPIPEDQKGLPMMTITCTCVVHYNQVVADGDQIVTVRNSLVRRYNYDTFQLLETLNFSLFELRLYLIPFIVIVSGYEKPYEASRVSAGQDLIERLLGLKSGTFGEFLPEKFTKAPPERQMLSFIVHKEFMTCNITNIVIDNKSMVYKQNNKVIFEDDKTVTELNSELLDYIFISLNHNKLELKKERIYYEYNLTSGEIKMLF